MFDEFSTGPGETTAGTWPGARVETAVLSDLSAAIDSIGAFEADRSAGKTLFPASDENVEFDMQPFKVAMPIQRMPIDRIRIAIRGMILASYHSLKRVEQQRIAGQAFSLRAQADHQTRKPAVFAGGD
jgi:hypothetical protein